MGQELWPECDKVTRVFRTVQASESVSTRTVAFTINNCSKRDVFAHVQRSTHCTTHVPPTLNAKHSSPFLGGSVGAAAAPSRPCDSNGDRRHLPVANKRAPPSHPTNGPAALPARPREAAQPAPAAAHTDVPKNLVPSTTSGRADRCADAPAMRRSCARHSGGDGSVEARRSHSKGCHVSELATRKTRFSPEF